MSHSAHHKHGKSGGSFLVAALGAALASAAGYMYVTHKEDIDNEAKKRIQQLAKMFHQSKPQIEKRVKQVWGEVNKNGIATYLDLRGMLLHALENEAVSKKGEMVKKRYDEMVDKVIASAKKSGVLTPEIEKKLSETLKMDWNEVQKVLTDVVMMGASKTASALKKMNSSKQAKVAKKVVSSAAKKLVKRAQQKMAQVGRKSSKSQLKNKSRKTALLKKGSKGPKASSAKKAGKPRKQK